MIGLAPSAVYRPTIQLLIFLLFLIDWNISLCLCYSVDTTEEGQVELWEGARQERRTDEAEIILAMKALFHFILLFYNSLVIYWILQGNRKLVHPVETHSAWLHFHCKANLSFEDVLFSKKKNSDML